MNQLYRHKWDAAEGGQLDGNEYSGNFKLWARKTEHISDGGFRRGFERLEHQVQQAGNEGKEAWPPSYAEFVGYCEAPANSKMYTVVEPKKALPEPEAIKSKRERAASTTLNGLKDLFE